MKTFKDIDHKTGNTGTITRQEWGDTLVKKIGVNIPISRLARDLDLDNYIIGGIENNIDYESFLSRFNLHIPMLKDNKLINSLASWLFHNRHGLEALYLVHADLNKDGVISKSEFLVGLETLKDRDQNEVTVTSNELNKLVTLISSQYGVDAKDRKEGVDGIQYAKFLSSFIPLDLNTEIPTEYRRGSSNFWNLDKIKISMADHLQKQIDNTTVK